MLSCKKRLFRKGRMSICVGGDHDELDFSVGKELLGRAIVLDRWEINGAV
jgi:hypothetical protein